MMDGWHDDVVDMMMETLTMTIVRNSETSFDNCYGNYNP